MAGKDSFLYEKSESFIWNENGDVNPKQDFNKINNAGFVWNIVISFPPDFAYNNGLITKSDYFSLTKNIMPSLINDMGLRFDNTIWYASLHRNTDNPHLHILISEKIKTKNKGFISQYAIHNVKSNIANYLIDNTEFYRLRDMEFSKIVGDISLKELTRIQRQKLYSDSFRKGLNKKLLSLYEKIPSVGRLQYNSNNMKMYKKDINDIIFYILNHDSVKYNYANYLRLLEVHQKELNILYGNTNDNNNRKYYNEQLNKLYSKIGNEILKNYKLYQSKDLMEHEISFLSKHIFEIKFRSRSDYAKEETRISIAKDLYKLCKLLDLNDTEIKKVFTRWNNNSKYNFDNIDNLIMKCITNDYEMTPIEFYKILNRLGYSYERYSKFKNKNFYKELNYKKFVNEAFNHLTYELEQEEKQIISSMRYDLDNL